MKNILLAVSGLSPQIITEALYALWHEGRTISSIHVITTRSGKDRILSELLAPEDVKFLTLLTDCDIDPSTIDFGSHNIHVLRNAASRELDDIVTPEDNEILIQTCLESAFQFTADPTSANCDQCFLEATEILASNAIARMYERIPGSRLIDEMSDSGIYALNRENFQSYKSKIRRDLLTAFGQSRVAELEISATGTRPDTRCGIRLDRNRIRMEW